MFWWRTLERRHSLEREGFRKETRNLSEAIEEKRLERLHETARYRLRAMGASRNVAYLAGASEDAHLGEGGNEGYVFDMESKSKRWLTEVVQPILQQELSKKQALKIKQRGTRREYRVQVWDKDLVDTLRVIKDQPDIVQSWNRPQQYAWIRGFADAEGSATRNSEGQPQFSIYNKSIVKLRIIGEILGKDEIHSGFYLPPDRDVWQMFITGRENLQRFFEMGPGVSHPEKRLRLQQCLAE